MRSEVAEHRSLAFKLTLIAGGYVIAIVLGIAVVVVHAWLLPAEVIDQSGGMVAFGEMSLFVLAAGFASVVPTWFLLKLLADRAPRLLLSMLVVVAILGPSSWLLVILPEAVTHIFGLLVPLVAIPRIMAAPVVLVVGAIAMHLLSSPRSRAIIAGAMLLDIVPLALFAWHLARATGQ